ISATHLGHYRELGRPNVPGHLFAEFGNIDAVACIADHSVAGVMLEPIQSMAGVRMAEPGFYRALRELCDEHGIFLIYDEVQTGVGRTGSWFFSGTEAGGQVVPDVITLAKSLASGVPVGACLTTDRVARQLKTNDLGTTFGGGMLAMAAVLATLEAIENDHLMENITAVEDHLRNCLRAVKSVTAIRGKGALIGIEFDSPVALAIQKELISRRIITGSSSDPRTLRLLPPLCISTSEIDQFVTALREITEKIVTDQNA
ncbi:MAG: aspartate aminotransferase family protein, partial [Pyrinomonadaceae bacterium]